MSPFKNVLMLLNIFVKINFNINFNIFKVCFKSHIHEYICVGLWVYAY